MKAHGGITVHVRNTLCTLPKNRSEPMPKFVVTRLIAHSEGRSGPHGEQQSASTEPCSRPCILCMSRLARRLARRCMLKGSQWTSGGHELPRCRMGIGVE